MMDMNFPTFRSPFLNRICQQLQTRSKALKHKGHLTVVTKQPDDYEWFTLTFTSYAKSSCIIQFVEDNRVCVYIRSRKRTNRGKVLLRIDDINLVDNPQDTMLAIETTLDLSRQIEDGNIEDIITAIHSAWSRVEIRLI